MCGGAGGFGGGLVGALGTVFGVGDCAVGCFGEWGERFGESGGTEGEAEVGEVAEGGHRCFAFGDGIEEWFVWCWVRLMIYRGEGSR